MKETTKKTGFQRYETGEFANGWIGTGARTYGRLGRLADVEKKINECKKVGYDVKINSYGRSIDTVIVKDEGESVFRAIHKGDGVYIVIYNPDYYPKTKDFHTI